MKKILLLSSLSFIFIVSATAGNTKVRSEGNQQIIDQKSNSQDKKKKSSYDFCLFKFITPAKIENQSDSLRPATKATKEESTFREETSMLHEKPLCFLTFS